MSIYKVENVIAVQGREKLYCLEHTPFEDLENEPVDIYVESDRIDEEILQCDICKRII